jgi:2-polyprenyl-3-methyl-5-hydroxy-6-metoxy-1,4-benzoquinol methylase
MAEENKDIKNLSHFFNDYAAGFSSIYEEDENPRSSFNKFIDKIFRRSMNLRFDMTLERTQKPEINTVLDIGCGPGHFVLQMLKQGKSITALDVAENMLNITKERVKKSELDQEKVNYICSRCNGVL